ncbi:MAG: GIY-YIG nuclease family protein [Azospirillaceae bacterium]
MSRQFHVYILTNRPRGTLYTGVTGNLPARMMQHRAADPRSFTARYNLHRLVLALPFEDSAPAIAFEKRLKRWARDWKIALIEKHNPGWDDLFEELNA